MLLMFGILHGTGSVEWPYPVARTALQYHERLNGAGYPQKLAGDDILLEARILAVADTVETMSSPRPNRPEMGLTKALEELKRTSSILYDSEVFKALVRLVELGKFKFQTLYN
jgi:HD-GYP domain-containing protein (c-di-GMP phosphodiesterase class II)